MQEQDLISKQMLVKWETKQKFVERNFGRLLRTCKHVMLRKGEVKRWKMENILYSIVKQHIRDICVYSDEIYKRSEFWVFFISHFNNTHTIETRNADDDPQIISEF